MVVLTNNLEIFTEYEVSKICVLSKGRSGDWEEINNDPKKGFEKEQPILSVMNHPQSFYKMEENGDIKLYEGDIDALKLNH